MAGYELHALSAIYPGAEAIMSAVYRRSLFCAPERLSFRKDGRAAQWALDVRRPLARGHILPLVSKVVADAIRGLGCNQVAGFGVGSSLLVGGVLSQTGIRAGGIIREARKAYGFREHIEGYLSKDRPIAVVDDILSTGATFALAITILREQGYRPIAAVPLFHFAWRDGKERLAALGVEVLPMASLHYLEKGSIPVRWEVQSDGCVMWEIR